MNRVLLFALAGATACFEPAPRAVVAQQTPNLALAKEKPAAPIEVTPRDLQLVGLAEALPEVAESAVQSVVSVATRRSLARAPGMPGGQGLGSGVIVRQDGIVVTNHHVVAGADEVVVLLSDSRRAVAEVVGADPKSDLAVLRLQDPPDNLVPLPFGDSDGLRLGEVVLAVGNPFGIGQTVTMGIVSAKGRANVGIVDYEDFIQTDAAINPGNSGGALVDLDGTLVGINTAIASRSGGSQGIGFSIPADMVEQVVGSILEDGRVERGWLGVVIQDLDPAELDQLGLEGGILIARVQDGAPAAEAGLQAGDVVMTFQGQPVLDVARFRNSVAASGARVPFRVGILRDGSPAEVQGTLAELPSQ